VLFSDTVGLIQKLPTQLVASFRATLEEIAAASVVVHVLDISAPNAAAQCSAVLQVGGLRVCVCDRRQMLYQKQKRAATLLEGVGRQRVVGRECGSRCSWDPNNLPVPLLYSATWTERLPLREVGTPNHVLLLSPHPLATGVG
jgi:hypothetical protein